MFAAIRSKSAVQTYYQMTPTNVAADALMKRFDVARSCESPKMRIRWVLCRPERWTRNAAKETGKARRRRR
jgi:hypothetical protein